MKRNHKPFIPLSWEDVPLLLSLNDAAQIVGLSYERCRQLAQLEDSKERFPAGKVGGSWRVSKEALFDYLQKRGITPA